MEVVGVLEQGIVFGIQIPERKWGFILFFGNKAV